MRRVQERLEPMTSNHHNLQEELRVSTSTKVLGQHQVNSKQESIYRMQSVLQRNMEKSQPQDATPPLNLPPTTKRKEAESTSRVHREELWPNAAIDVLLLKFEDLCYDSHRGRQLGKTHWGRIAAAVNAACNANYSGVQCKYKWNRLKKSYNKAKLHGDPSRFVFYNHVDRIVRKASGQKIEEEEPEQEQEQEHEQEEDDVAEAEDDVDSTCEAASNESRGSPSMSATEDDDDDDDVDRRARKRRAGALSFRSSSDSFGHKIERRMTSLAQSMEIMQRSRTDELKKLIDAQMEITTVLVKNNKGMKQSDGIAPCSVARETREIGLAPPRQGGNTSYVPPLNFAMVDKGVYRSGFPNRANFPFLKTLKLRSIIYLCQGPYPEINVEFLRAENIQIFHFGKERFQGTIMGISEDVICEALKILLDTRNHPVLIHCKRGKRPTSCLVACLRKVQNWCLASVFDEYQRFTGVKSRITDLQFIERFNVPHI